MPDPELEKYIAMWDKMRAAGVGPVPAEELPSHMRSQLHQLRSPEQSPSNGSTPSGSRDVLNG